MDKIDCPTRKQYMEEVKPDTGNALFQFQSDIIALHCQGYSMKLIWNFVRRHGFGGGYSGMVKWVRANIDLEKEESKFREVVASVRFDTSQAVSAPGNLRIEPSEDLPTSTKEVEVTAIITKESAKNSAIPAETLSSTHSELEGSSKRDPRAIMQSILGPSIEEQMSEI